MRLLVVADGPRDAAAIPGLVNGILNTDLETTFRPWREIQLRRGSGYRTKLKFALRDARDQDFNGVVATVDCDKAPRRERLSELSNARTEDRTNARLDPIPAAIGEANPHLEAWLLDDQQAVRKVLRFPNEKLIPNVIGGDPKTCADVLIAESSRTERPLVLLAEIAAEVQVDRCPHSNETGLQEFATDVRTELGRL